MYTIRELCFAITNPLLLFHTLTSVGRKKLFNMFKTVAAYSCCSKLDKVEICIKEPVFIRTLRLKFHCLINLRTPKRLKLGWLLYNGFHVVDLKTHESKFSEAVCAFQVAPLMTSLLYKNSGFKVFSRIIKNSCAENKACGVHRNRVKNLVTGWN